MSKKKDIIATINIKTDYSKLPNPWHFQQVLKGRKIHKSDKYILPRKKKYKDKEVKDYE